MKAFTLAEILLVMVLLSVVAIASLPNLSKYYTQIQLQNAANNLSYSMRYAQSRAITQSKNIQLSFDKSYKKYRLLEKDIDAPIKDFKPLKGKLGTYHLIPSEISIKSSNATVDFLPNGEIEKINILLCYKKDCTIVTSQQQRGQIEILDAN